MRFTEMAARSPEIQLYTLASEHLRSQGLNAKILNFQETPEYGILG